MKMNKFFMGIAASAALALGSCSSEEVVLDPTDNGSNDDSVAYVLVSVRDAGSLSRGEEGGFSDVEGTEGQVNSCHFFFYDENGIFVSEATAWDGANNLVPENDNINFKGKNIVMLKGLKNKKHPKYVVTILNKPTSFKVPEGSSLDDMEAMLSMAANTTGMLNGGVRAGQDDKYFIMTTTSVANQTIKESGHNTNNVGKHLPKAFVTELLEKNFIDDPEGVLSDDNAAKIYVERLAAKVTLKIQEPTGEPTGTELVKVGTDSDGKSIYKMKVTLAGAVNSEDEGDNKAAEFVYVKFTNWGLNNTAKTSYMVKNFDAKWDDAANEFANPQPPFAGWTGVADPYTGTLPVVNPEYRSYWAKAWTYDDNSDNKYNRLTEKTLFNASAFGTRVQNGFNKNLYCAENTHSGKFLSTESNFNNVTTSVLLGARIYKTAECKEADVLDLVRYNGVLYIEYNYINYELSVLSKAGNLNYYTKSGETYTQVSKDQVKVVPAGVNGKMKLQTTLAASTQLYMKNSDGTFSAITDGVSKLNDAFTAFNASVPAYRHKEGLMYYNIPIQHFAGHDDSQDLTYTEGEYGIVRNHHYVLTITMLKNLGAGVFDPSTGEEPIIPDDPDEELYQVGAQINILSWKVVNQSGIEL